MRRVAEHFDCCPDRLSSEQLEIYFAALVDSHFWSTVKVDRIGLQFFWRHFLKLDWRWIEIIKVPRVKSLPDILTVAEIEQLISATRHLRYRGCFGSDRYRTLARLLGAQLREDIQLS